MGGDSQNWAAWAQLALTALALGLLIHDWRMRRL